MFGKLLRKMKLQPRHMLMPAYGLMMMCSSCFTGIESTPRISDSEVNRNNGQSNIDRQDLLSGIIPQAASNWRKGKRFLVDDNKISLIFTSSSAVSDSLAGTEILFDSIVNVPSLTGERAYEIRFLRASATTDTFYYRLPTAASRSYEADGRIEIPFTIDISLASRADSILRGNSYYITTPNWYNPSSRMKECEGLRHVEVIIDSVVPGTSTYPLAAHFHIADSRNAEAYGSADEKAVYLTVGNSRTATRNFQRLFALTNPRKSYPHITDEVWELIIRSRIRRGMSRDEVRLALGAPPAIERTPVRNGFVERWTYSDGVYLIFDSDGFLSTFRQ